MSLTSAIRTPEFKEKMKELFPKPKIRLNKEISIKSPVLVDHSGIIIVGNSYDYLLRFYFNWKYKNNNVLKNPTDEIVASYGLNILKFRIDENEYAKLEKTFSICENIVEEVIKTTEWNPTDEFYFSIIYFSNLDLTYRVGLIDHLIEDSWKDNINIQIQELKNLENTLRNFKPQPEEQLLLNPRFQKIPRCIGKADADLVIDKMLIDIKTVKKLQFSLQSWHQLIGYLTLFKMNEINLNIIALYFSRYDYLLTINVYDYISKESIDKFIVWLSQQD